MVLTRDESEMLRESLDSCLTLRGAGDAVDHLLAYWLIQLDGLMGAW
jgi:hypothetical protein